MQHRLLIFVALLVIAAGTRWWLLTLSDEPPAPAVPTVRSDYSLNNFQLRVADQTGLVTYQLSGPHLVQDAAANNIVITDPKILLYEQGSLDWQAQATSATLNLEADQLALSGAVELSNPQHVIRTSDLHIDNRQRLATSDSDAAIQQGNDSIKGRGLRVELDSRTIQLSSDVRAHYEPKT